MKKMFVLALVVMLVATSAAIAATAKKTTTVKVTTVSQPEKASEMKIGLGVYQGLAGMKFLTDSFNGVVGLFFSSASAAGATNTTFGMGGNVTFNLTGGAIPTHAGGALTFTSLPGGASSFTLAGIYGAETTIADHLNIGVDIFPLSLTSASAAGATTTTFTLLTGTVYAFYVF